jgi:type I restriction-modification system DNA methylase subunit
LSAVLLSTNEIRAKASTFAESWKDANREKSETQTFWNEFFAIFGIKRRSVAVYEEQVSKLNGNTGFIDLFWPEVLLIEQKSKGRDLNKAMEQADEYFLQLEEKLRPRHILACDFQTWHLVDRDEGIEYNFKLSELPEKIEYFNFMRGLTQEKIHDEDPVSIKASELMGKIYDNLKKSGYPKHEMEFFLTRLTYCLFADDTDIFEPHILYKYIKNRTSEDGTDLGGKLIQLFQVLDKPIDSRQTNLDEDLVKFPYVNGSLFKDTISIPSFDSKMRDLLIEASDFDWSKISPAIFGSLFQSVMNSEERRKGGSHYTSEENILKVIRPLFLDDLTKEFETMKNRKDNHRIGELKRFQTKLSSLKFLDPACGAGNFLIIAYREIRKLELKVILEIHDKKVQLIDTSTLSKVDVDQFYGIEINEFSARIAETALWMMDHIMNRELSEHYGEWGTFTRIPLENHPNIVNADALEVDWNEIIPSSECSYILGNPPYGGAKTITVKQRDQIKKIANLGKSGGTLDYVCAWLLKSGQYADKITPIGFVTTNSISQGEQIGQLWPILLEKHGLKINFAYKQFKWASEARGKAAVIVIILGLSKINKSEKRLFYCETEIEQEENPKFISPYLIGSHKELSIVKETSKPLNGLTQIVMGSQPIDNGNYIFTDLEREEFLIKEPNAKNYLKPFVGARDFLNGNSRWILKLHDVKPQELQKLPEIKKRIAAVKLFRSESKRVGTKRLAETPVLYQLNVMPTKPFLIIPAHSSERREYIPIGFVEPPIIPSNATLIIEDANPELFGLLISKMHMIWVRLVGGKIKTDLRYSAGMIYNTFPIPDTNCDNLKPLAQKILDIRKHFKDSSLADLYDPDTMPPDLKKAHLRLDREVEKLYRKKPFVSDQERIEFLLSKYDEMRVQE